MHDDVRGGESTVLESTNSSDTDSFPHEEAAVNIAPAISSLDHEDVGELILSIDDELRAVLQKNGVEPDRVFEIVKHKDPERGVLSNIISSDLDCDRIDYLLRTAHHTGLPYGTVDLEYILTQIRVDSDGQIAFKSKAQKAADHFLLSRYFDNQQVAFHKAVAGLELVLKDVIGALLVGELLKLSADDVRSAIENGTWKTLNDESVMNRIGELVRVSKDPVTTAKCQALLRRKPPKMLVHTEYLDEITNDSKRHFRIMRSMLTQIRNELSAQFDLEAERFYLWEQSGIQLTKIGGRIELASIVKDARRNQEKQAQLIRILEEDGTSQEIVNYPGSLMKVLSDYGLFSLRLYGVIHDLPDDQVAEVIETAQRKWHEAQTSGD